MLVSQKRTRRKMFVPNVERDIFVVRAKGVSLFQESCSCGGGG